MVWRAARVEALRLFADPALAACLGVALLPAISLVSGLAEGGRPPSTDALAGTLRLSLLANIVLLAASFGAVRTAAAFRSGIIGRDALVLRSGIAFWMRVVSSAAGASLIALGAWSFACIGTRVFSDLDVFDTASLGAALLAGAAGGVWGATIGALVRAPLAVLPVVIMTLSPALLVASLLPAAVIALPLGSGLLALGVPIVEARGEHGWSAAITFLWLVAALGSSFALHRLRPLLA